MKRKAAAFNLIELMVVMGVAAVLIIIGLSGARMIQQRSRDALREDVLAQISEAINAYRIVTLKFPSNANVSFQTDGFYINGVKEVDLTKHTKSGSSTTDSQTLYYYNATSQGYLVCTELESGSIESVGTGTCPDPLP
ncbi:type II secretion system protein [Candidatus Dojkabacteria bacterium]|uniref:Type II secretion system protein n=1 Tax=Candidatus Dojkabacteria bacterium TaxID=2099670 RepID=A0A955L2C7_9BACT|nr:type II secretion system protein [Candidatus Dojkabacteria bacterium]